MDNSVTARPRSNHELIKLPTVGYNQCLQDTLAYFNHKRVRMKDGLIGIVIGVDPRPMKNGNPTATGQDGNYLVIRIECQDLPGHLSHTNAYAMPDDLEIIEKPIPKELELKT